MLRFDHLPSWGSVWSVRTAPTLDAASPTEKTQAEPPEVVRPLDQSIVCALKQPWAVVESGLRLVQRLSWRAPMAAAQRLAPLCTSTWSRGALIGAFVGTSICLPLAMSLAADLVRNRWHQALFAKRIEALSQSVGRQPERWNLPQPDPASKSLPVLCAQELGDEGLFLDEMTIAAASDIITFVSTACVDVGQLMMVNSPVVLAIAIGAALVAYGVARLQGGAPVRESMALRDSRGHLLAQGPTFWDNVVLGNEEHVRRWHDGMFAATRSFFRSKAENFFNTVASSYASSIPHMMAMYAVQADGIFPEANEDRSPGALQSTLLPSLQIIASTFGNGCRLAQLHLRLDDVRRRNEAHAKNFEPLYSPSVSASPIDTQGIRLLEGGEPLSVADLLEDPSPLAQPGRRTVRGGNGLGKTNFLLRLKRHFGSDAYFLPTAHVLNMSRSPGSTGQQVVQAFKYLDKLPKRPKVLLLDEWTAHLDSTNRAELDDMILRWSKHHSVIEIVH